MVGRSAVSLVVEWNRVGRGIVDWWRVSLFKSKKYYVLGIVMLSLMLFTFTVDLTVVFLGILALFYE